MTDIKISVILPTYNRAELLKSAIKSVLAQTYPYFELIIVDDGSEDHTEEAVRTFKDGRIRYFKLPQNEGQAKARNYGIEMAAGDYIAFEDSDDIWHPQKLEVQMDYMEKSSPKTGFVYHKIRYDMGNNCFAVLPSEEIDRKKKSGDIYAQLLYDNLVPCPSILAKKECILKAGGFDTGMKALEDYDLALKMAKNFEALFVDKVLLDAAYSTNGVSGQSVNYLVASCYLVQKYKEDYLSTDTLNHRIEVILRDADRIGMKAEFIRLTELSLR